MKVRFYLILSGVILGSCFMRCALSKSHPRSGRTTPQQTGTYSLSPFTSLFLSDLEKIVPVDHISDTFIPPEALREKYGIIRLNDRRYSICGFIKHRADLPELEMKRRGIQISPSSGDFSTVCIPLAELNAFLHQKGITYFAISAPAK